MIKKMMSRYNKSIYKDKKQRRERALGDAVIYTSIIAYLAFLLTNQPVYLLSWSALIEGMSAYLVFSVVNLDRSHPKLLLQTFGVFLLATASVIYQLNRYFELFAFVLKLLGR